MSVDKPYAKIHFLGRCKVTFYRFFDKSKLTAFLYWENVFFQKRGTFSTIGLCRPPPMRFITPVCSVFKCKFVFGFIRIPFYCSTAMVEMQMCQKYIGNIIGMKSVISKRLFQTVFSI